MSARIFLANIGANASHRYSSPLYPDGTFELITIPEDRPLDGPHIVRYRDVSCFNDPHGPITDLVPQRYWDAPTHYDPEFDTMTYGDNCETAPRAAGLKQMAIGDFIFFIARLNRWNDAGQGNEFGFYLIGFLEVENILRNVREMPSKAAMRRFGRNAHVRRGLTDDSNWDGFWVFAGSERSRRFEKAVPVTRQFAASVFSASDGTAWKWDPKRSDLQVIGSYTRACRMVIDPATTDGARRSKAFWDWVNLHSQ
jgi:hypothetical protein